MTITVAGQRRDSHRTSLSWPPARRPAGGKYQGRRRAGVSRGRRGPGVDLDGLLRDRRPAELRQHPLAAGRAHRGGPRRVGQQLADPGGQAGLEGGGVVGVVVDQQAGAAVGDDLRDAADVAGHDGRAARGGLEVDDAERLVHRGDDEHRRAGDQRDQLLAREHRLDPDHAAAPRLQLRDRVGHLLPLARGVGGSGAEDQAGLGRQLVGGRQQVDDALLPGDPADEQRVGPVRVHAKPADDVRRPRPGGRPRRPPRCRRRAPARGRGRDRRRARRPSCRG